MRHLLACLLAVVAWAADVTPAQHAAADRVEAISHRIWTRLAASDLADTGGDVPDHVAINAWLVGMRQSVAMMRQSQASAVSWPDLSYLTRRPALIGVWGHASGRAWAVTAGAELEAAIADPGWTSLH